MIQFTEDHVRRLLPMTECIEAMRSVFRALAAGEAINQPRRRLYTPTGAVLHALAGYYGRYFGTKVYATHVKHGAHFFFLLFDAATAAPLAQFEANYLGQIRTGAASGLAVDLLAPQRDCSLAVIGSGFQARSQVDAIRAVRRLSSIKVWSRNAEKRARFAAEAQAEATETAEQAVRGVDIVVTATWAKDPVVQGEWVSPDAVVCAMGSNDPKRRELPGDLVTDASALIADDVEQARIEAGDFTLALDEAGWQKIIPLANVVSGKTQVPERGVRIFKSVGLGLEDVAAAAVVYERWSQSHYHEGVVRVE